MGAGSDAGALRGRALTGRITASQGRVATILFAVAAAASGVALLAWLADLTFWRDEWAFLLHRRGLSADVFLRPHYEHIAIAPVAIYKLLLSGFGMDSPRPFQIAATAAFLTSVTLVFVYLRRRVGAWLALAGVLPLLFFGPSWDDLLWPFQIGYFGSMAAGVGALLALDREHRDGDLLACALLALSLSFSSLGIPFAAGVGVHVLAGPEVRRRAYIAAVPIALFSIWWLGFGRTAEHQASLANLLGSPGYVFDGFASSLASLLGLASSRLEFPISSLDWGRPLIIALLGLAAVRVYRLGRVTRGLLVTLVLGLSFWFLAGLNAAFGRDPDVGRYQYVGAIFILLIVAELLRGVRIPRSAVPAAVAVSALAALSNVWLLQHYANGLAGLAGQQRGGLAAIELASDHVDPAFQLSEENSDVDYLGELDAGSYLSAVDAFGSPAYTPEQLVAAAEPSRVAADKVATSALGIRLEPESGPVTGEACLVARPKLSPGSELVLELPPGGAVLHAATDTTAAVRIRRFATASFPVGLGTVDRGMTAALRIPVDLSRELWEASLKATGPVTVCELDDR